MRHMMLRRIRPARLPQARVYVDRESVTYRRIHTAVYSIEQRFDEPPSVSSIAEHVGMSARQLERLFKTSLGMTPAALYRAMRLQYGKWQLTNTKNSATSIALSCGFSDSSHFSKAFRQHFGQTPRSMRAL